MKFIFALILFLLCSTTNAQDHPFPKMELKSVETYVFKADGKEGVRAEYAINFKDSRIGVLVLREDLKSRYHVIPNYNPEDMILGSDYTSEIGIVVTTSMTKEDIEKKLVLVFYPVFDEDGNEQLIEDIKNNTAFSIQKQDKSQGNKSWPPSSKHESKVFEIRPDNIDFLSNNKRWIWEGSTNVKKKFGTYDILYIEYEILPFKSNNRRFPYELEITFNLTKDIADYWCIADIEYCRYNESGSGGTYYSYGTKKPEEILPEESTYSFKIHPDITEKNIVKVYLKPKRSNDINSPDGVRGQVVIGKIKDLPYKARLLVHFPPVGFEEAVEQHFHGYRLGKIFDSYLDEEDSYIVDCREDSKSEFIKLARKYGVRLEFIND